MRGYRQLTLEQRYQIQTLFSIRYSKTAIAKKTGVHRSTVSRELRRNSVARCAGWPRHYAALRAQDLYLGRRKTYGESKQKIRGELRELVETRLRFGWSPEQISGRLKKENEIILSFETIYQHILRDCKNKGALRYYLRFRGYKHHRFKKSKHAINTRNRRHYLKDRPCEANERLEAGHWERDLVEGKKGGSSLLTIVDRKTRYTLLRWVNGKTVEEVGRETVRALKPFKVVNKTLTNDNGIEFQKPEELEKKIKSTIYYTDPSSPWQRGTVENTNGLIRQYFRKGTALETYARWLPRAIEETLNHRPRKTLEFCTPHEIMFNQTTKLLRDTGVHFGLEFASSS